MNRKMLWGLSALGVVVVGGGLYAALRPAEQVKWRTAKVERGNVVQRISATGTLSALVQVPVGTQVSGTISALYADYNSLVKKGQVIAQIDSTVWETQLKDAQASLERAKANLEDAQRQYQRTKRLAAEKLVSDQDLDIKETSLKTTQASFQTAQAALDRAKANLGYCTITAPVDGVVVGRSVDVGQTVTTSFNTPNLFTIAQDLSKMKLEVSIDEADIGQVKVGQPAFFTVDSYPDKQFRGTVAQVRLEPITQQNVVTYKVVMEVQNEPLVPQGNSPAPAAPKAAEAPKAPRTEAARPEGARPEGGQGGFGMGRGGMDPAAREALMKKLGFTPEDLQDPAKREAFRAKMRERREHDAPAATMGVTAARPSQGQPKRTPGGINFADGPIYSGNLALRPGMTANVTIFTNRREDVLRVPSVALRFNPTNFLKTDKKPAPAAPQAQAARGQGQGQGPGQGQRGGMPRSMTFKREDKVWVLENGMPKELVVKAGISDGQFTELSGDTVTEGLEVLTGVEDTKKPAPAQTSPFAPQRRR